MCQDAVCVSFQVRTNLILFKICTDELGYNDTFCEETDTDEYEEVEDDIQSRQRILNKEAELESKFSSFKSPPGPMTTF